MHITSAEHAEKLYNWLLTRGGIAVWKSVNLSNPGGSWTTPATHEDGSPVTKPTWQAGDTPEILTDPAHVLVAIDREVKRFRIAVRMGSQGTSLKLTDYAGKRLTIEKDKVRDALIDAAAAVDPTADLADLEKAARKKIFHVFDYETQEAVIMVTDRTVPLTDYIKENV